MIDRTTKQCLKFKYSSQHSKKFNNFLSKHPTAMRIHLKNYLVKSLIGLTHKLI